ncbi:MAG TPA: phenylalanine--tRNA ligase subunit beta, partial [Pyrinomonadaceae bacterium]|nr:phenylalanine--tRNA ligase subunit beta [Pyrinomonadaceae bacterium]
DLDETMLVIADAEKPAAVAGVMGGLASSITDSTTDVLLEVAYFKRENIRQTSRKLRLTTEASTRFERGTDIENLIAASNRAAQLICELAGGEMGEFVDVYPTNPETKEVKSTQLSQSVDRLTGLKVSENESLTILASLGISYRENDPTTFIVPSWRHDLAIEEDLVEEVARLVGYENIAEELPPAFGAGEYQRSEPRKKRLRQALVDLGFNEAVSYSFIDTDHDGRFGTVPGILDAGVEEKFVTLQDSVIEGAIRMRPTLLPGLLDSVRINFNQQRKDLRLFEIGKAFAARAGEDGLPTEKELFSIVVTGGEAQANRAMTQRELDFYDAKGAVEAALAAVGFPSLSFSPGEAVHLRKGQSALIYNNGVEIGSIGRLNETLSADYKFKQPVYVAELDLQAVLGENTSPVMYHALPKYPSVVRDVSFLMKRTMGFEEIRGSIMNQGRDLCRAVGFVDVYEGKGIDHDERSLTVRLEYRSDERTLVDTEVDDVHGELIDAVEKDLNIRRRF